MVEDTEAGMVAVDILVADTLALGISGEVMLEASMREEQDTAAVSMSAVVAHISAEAMLE